MSLAYAIQTAAHPARERSTVPAMHGTVATVEAAPTAEEARLARAAAAGDGSAFATLYERYAQRAYNLAYRIAGSEADAADAVQEAFLNTMRRLPKLAEREELAFGSYLFTATRNACYDLLASRRRTQPSEAISETATPLGSGAGGLGLDPGDPEEDPDRKVLISSQQEEIREASMRLPKRQREALALRELEELSYDEIATIMGMNRNSVAQLISRARINLRDELRSTALASVAASSPQCERALPLIAMRDDGQLESGSGDAAWLDAHLAGCGSCRVGMEAMAEAAVSYRAWAPIAVAPGLFGETMAKAAELAGADWSKEIEAHEAAARRRPRRRRAAALAAGLGALLILAGGAVVLGDDDPPSAPAEPAGATSPATTSPAPKGAKPKPAKTTQPEQAQTVEATPTSPQPVPSEPAAGAQSEPAERPKRAPEQAGVQPPRQAATPEPEPPPPPPAPPPPVVPPPVEEPPTTEEPEGEEPTEPTPPRDPTEPRDPKYPIVE